MKRCCAALALVGGLFAQVTDPSADLRRALQEAGGSTVEMTRALEQYLQKNPNGKDHDDAEKALVKIALEQHDNRRLVLYGERVLARDPNDLQLLDRVPRAMLAADEVLYAERALALAKRFEAALQKLEKDQPPTGREAGKMRDELDRAFGRALFYEAKANGLLGHAGEAVTLAQSSFDKYPTADAAREVGRWQVKAGKPEEAIRAYAAAFAIPDPHGSEADRLRDRQTLGALYRKSKGSDAGLGDVVLQEYDRTAALVEKRRELVEASDPNGQAKGPLDYTLTALEGQPLALPGLKGKVIVMDFWATWCRPCRQQHPLYEKVKEKFAAQKDVVFLAVNADEDRSAVQPFIAEQKWTNRIYFEDGLSNRLQVTSLPTTIIFNKRGELVARLNGFVPERFVDMLTERINEALR